MSYTEKDLNQTYTYVIHETGTAGNGVEIRDNPWIVTLRVDDAGEGVLEPTILSVVHKVGETETEVWNIFIQLVKGLKSLHDLRILHRDLKSANVFLFKNGVAKLGDLNVSKVAKRGLGYTQTGTPYYASPEVWKDLPYDNKSDIWSLGCVLYEMITLHPPFRAKNMEELYKKVLSGDISQLPSKFSSDLYEIVSLLIKVNSDKRPNCNEILDTIFLAIKPPSDKLPFVF